MERSVLIVIIFVFLISACQSRDCLTSCDQINLNGDRSTCIQNCYQAYIIACTVAGVVVIIIIVCLIFYCRGKKYQCVPWEMRRLRKLFNHVNPNLITPQQFQDDRGHFEKVILKSQKVNNLWFVKEEKAFAMQVQSIQFKKQAEFLYQMTIQGKDDFQEWQGTGYFLCGDDGPYVWFLKNYNNSEKVIQAGLLKYVIFEALKVRSRSYEGKWYCKDEERNDKLSGKWTMLMQVVNHIDNRLQEIRTESIIA